MQCVWVEAAAFFINNISVVETYTRLTDTEKKKKKKSNFWLHCLSMVFKFKTGASPQTPQRCLSERCCSFSSASSPPPRSLISHLCSLFQHFSCLLTSFLQQRHVCFSDKRDDICRKKKRKKKSPSLLGWMSGAFEQYCWSNLPWGFGHWRTPDESERGKKKREGGKHTRGEKKKCFTIS